MKFLLSLVFLFLLNELLIRGEDDDRWNSLIHWSGGEMAVRATLVRSPAGQLLPSPDGEYKDCKHTVGDFNEELVVKLDSENDKVTYVSAQVNSYRPAFNGAIGAPLLRWHHSSASIFMNHNEVEWQIDFADAALVFLQQDFRYSMKTNEVKSYEERICRLFAASNKTLNLPTVFPAVILPDGKGGVWFENAAGTINVTNSTAGLLAVGRLNEDLTFELRPKWFHVHGRTGKMILEHDLDKNSTVFEVNLIGDRTARLFSPSRKVIVLYDRYVDVYELRVFDAVRDHVSSTVRFNAQNLRADNFSYNLAGRVMTLNDGGNMNDENNRGPEQLTITAGQSIQLRDARQVLRLNGQTISCQNSADREGERKTELTASADGFHINLADSVLNYDRTAGVFWINTTVGYVRIDVANRLVTPNDAIRSETNTLVSSQTQLQIGNKIYVHVEFGVGYVHIRYELTVHLSLVGAGSVETDIGEVGWMTGGGFTARCAGGRLRGAIQPMMIGREKGKSEREWRVSGQRVSATIAANGTIYARDDARELSFTTAEEQIEFCTYGVLLQIV